MAKKNIDIDKELFERCVRNLCTKRETAEILGVSETTLQRFCKREYGKSYQDVSASMRAMSILALREMGLEQARKSPATLIFFLKNFTEMTDKPIPEPDEAPIQVFMKALEIGKRQVEQMDVASMMEIPDGNAIDDQPLESSEA